MVDDVLTNKVATIEHSLRRIEEEYAGDERNLYQNVTRQDSIVLNLQRACQSAIDIAMHLVQIHGLGVPQESRDAFAFLIDAGLLDKELGNRLMRMVGFRNIAIHEYQRLDLDVVKAILEERIDDFRSFAAIVLTTRGLRDSP